MSEYIVDLRFSTLAQARRNNSRRRDASSSELTTTTPSQDRRAITTYTPPPRPVTAHGHRVEAPKPNVSQRQVQAPSHRSSTPGPNAPFTQDQRRSSTTQPQYHTPAASRFQPWRDQSGEFHPPQSPPLRSATSHGHRAATASLGQWQGQAPIERSRTPHAQHLGGRVPFQRDPEQVVHRTDQHMPTRTGASGGATSYASQGEIQADMRHLNEPIPQQRRHYDSVSADYSTIRSVPTSMGPSGRVDPQVEGTNTSGKRPPRMLRSVVGILRSKI